jgi:hypothetical protein
MNINKPGMPRFLKKAEQKLLLNNPGIWSTRTLPVLYYGVLFILLLAGLCFLEPNDVRDDSTTAYWIGFVSIICVLALTVWLIYLLRFNVFKKYGLIQPLHGLGTFILYFISTGIIVLFTFVHPVVESVRANKAFGDEEIVQDMNAMNVKLCQLEYQILQSKWDYDTVVLDNNITPLESSKVYDDDEPEVYEDRTATVKKRPPYIRLDSIAFKNRLNATDSVVKINDTAYLMYSTPTYTFFYSYRADNYKKQKLLSSFEIYDKALRRPPTTTERATISKELGALIEKYQNPEDPKNYGGLEIYSNDGPDEIARKRYRLGYMNGCISNIIEKKYRWTVDRLPDYTRLFYYVTLSITLLIFIFRHSTIRTFFLSLLTGVLLTIFTALILSFSHYEETTFFMWVIVYTILFFIGSLTVWSNKKRKAVTGIMINLFVFIVPVFPMLIVGWYYNWKRAQNYDQHLGLDLSYIENYFIYAEIGGALLFLVLLATYIGKLYRRWYSLPED